MTAACTGARLPLPRRGAAFTLDNGTILAMMQALSRMDMA
jgi:hypothetical protein